MAVVKASAVSTDTEGTPMLLAMARQSILGLSISIIESARGPGVPVPLAAGAVALAASAPAVIGLVLPVRMLVQRLIEPIAARGLEATLRLRYVRSSRLLIEGRLALHLANGKRDDLSEVRIKGLYVSDMIAHNNDHDRDVFQIAPGTDRAALWLAEQAQIDPIQRDQPTRYSYRGRAPA